MKKHLVLLATVSTLLVACGGGETEAMDPKAQEMEATADELLDKVNAEADAATQAASDVVDSTAAAVEEVKEAVY